MATFLFLFVELAFDIGEIYSSGSELTNNMPEMRFLSSTAFEMNNINISQTVLPTFHRKNSTEMICENEDDLRRTRANDL